MSRLRVALTSAAWLAGAAAAHAIDPGTPASLATADRWRAEFDQVCARTQEAMTLRSDELKKLLERADALMPKLEKLEESQRKVMTRRLRGCRNLYQFVLDSREAR